MRFLVDTNVLAERLRPRPNAGVVERLTEFELEIATAAPVWHEMLHGARRLPPSAKRLAIERFLDRVVGATLPILPYDAAAADWHAAQRARLVGAGQTPPYLDGQIAAIAAVNGLTLVTANVADFA